MDLTHLIMIALKGLAVVLLVLLNGFFVASEYSMVKIRATQLDPMLKRGYRRARVTQRILGNLNKTLSSTQLGVTFTSLGLGWIGEPFFADLLEPIMRWGHVESVALLHSAAFAVGFSAITFLHITAGEQVPKWLAIQRPLGVALWISPPLAFFQTLTSPCIWVLNHSTQWLLRRLGVEAGLPTELSHTEDELRLLVVSAYARSRVTTLGREIVINAMELQHRVAREVMRPRKDVVVLDTTSTLEACLELAERTRFSRFPLCEDGDLDKTRGVVHIKDLFSLRHKMNTAAELLPTARKIIYVPETARLETLLQRLLDRKLHVAIVVDEYGGTLGMLTLENILEQLVGQIQDEFDQEKPLLTQTSEQSWTLEGTLPLYELENLIHERFETEEVTTVSGWVTRRLGGFPKVGDKITVGSFSLQVEELDGMRVARLTLRRCEEPAIIGS